VSRDEKMMLSKIINYALDKIFLALFRLLTIGAIEDNTEFRDNMVKQLDANIMVLEILGKELDTQTKEFLK
jgi:hypothetical protein